MKKIYLDNAATTFPKPPSVADAVYDYIKNTGVNIGRGAYSDAFAAASAVYETRELLCGLFGFDKPSNVIFTVNVTEALNIVIKGLLKAGDHVLVSSLEHNSVMRPLTQLLAHGITFDRIPSKRDGTILWDDSLVRKNTRAVIMTHVSNVCGTIMPVEQVGRICAERGITFIVDSAQSAGILPIDMKKMNIDVLCFTGHKGLYGPQGTGGFIINDKTAERLEPLISGGTGSISDRETLPDFMPDRFEAGTLNIPGIYGLREGLKFIESTGLDSIRRHEIRMTEAFLGGLEGAKGLSIAGINGTEGRTAVISLDTDMDPSELSFELEHRYGIITRVGMHCSPSAHKALGTFPKGTIRFSFGFFNTVREAELAAEAVKKILLN